FQAEDGIRDDLVTGVQTCALPISFKSLIEGVQFKGVTVHAKHLADKAGKAQIEVLSLKATNETFLPIPVLDAKGKPVTKNGKPRSEERRVGKEGRSGGWMEQCDRE